MAWYTRLFQTIFRLLFILLDWVVYTCVRVFYNLFDAIASIRLFAGTNDDSSLIQEVADRVYVLIGVYALFKVVFVLINMMVNPSDGSKGEKSIGKLATRIFVMLALIIITPYIFNVAYQFQALVLDENVIGKIITGDDMTSGENDDIGQTISNQIFSSFVSVNPTAMENPDESIANFDDLDPESILNSDAKDSCADSLDSLMKVYQQSDTGVSTNDGVFSMIMPVTNVFESSETGKDEFCIEYSYLISTIAGGFAAFAFAVYCLDIGLRVAKLAFYELIAPIPIVSYIDGKKDGPFYKWSKQTAMTYADIFIRLIIINFIILIIKDGLPEIMKMEVITEHDIITQLLAKAAIILGLLMFAKQAPQLICDLLGVESKGTFGFNAKEKLAKSPIAAGAVGYAAGAITSGAANLAAVPNRIKTAVKATDDAGGSRSAKILSGIKAGAKAATAGVAGGAMSGGLRAGKSFAQGGKNAKFGQILASTTQTTNTKRNERDKAKSDFSERTSKGGVGYNYTRNISNASGIGGKAGAFLATAKARAGGHFSDFGGNISDSYKRFSGTNVKENKMISGDIAAWQDEINSLDKIISADISNGRYGVTDITAGDVKEDSYIASDGSTQKYKYRAFANAEYENIQKRKSELSAKIKYEQERLEKGKQKKEESNK